MRSDQQGTTVIIFNGPPGSGKDYAVLSLTAGRDQFVHQELKNKLIELTCAIYSIDRITWDRMYADRAIKESPHEILGGRTMREALIHTSEVVIKPVFGPDYFGRAAAANLVPGKVNLFSDGGFDAEIIPIADTIGWDAVHVIRIHADGKTYEQLNDSRSYVKWAGAGDVKNHFDAQFMQDLETEVTRFLATRAGVLPVGDETEFEVDDNASEIVGEMACTGLRP